ncbi:MAG TPA: thiolase family protein [Streptosporangiaceae bacterium]|jgi:acetyl-CoA acetyltransferase
MAEPAVVSYGSSTYSKRPERELGWHLWQAARACLDRAGLDSRDVDGLALASFGYPPGNVVTLAEHFGIRLSWAEQGAFGGASSVIALGHAAHAIRAGQVRNVLILAGDVFSVASHDALLDSFTPAIRDHLAPHGFGGANGIFALVQSKHASRYGTTREQLGRIAVTQREHALLNHNALFRQPLSMQEYLTARPIAEPIRLFDCVMPCSGAEAVLICARDTAAALGRPVVEVLSMREVHNGHPGNASSLPAGWELAADSLFAGAGVSRSEVDFAQLYDDYPIMVAIQLEGYGFCKPGGAGPFLEDTDISIRGDLPVNTGGGQLSCGQCGAGGGCIGLVEGITQLQHEAGARQVPDAVTGLVSGFGMVSYGKGLCTAGTILRRAA